MIIEGLLENNRAATPDIFLLNANGITNFRRAVFYALDKDVDVILYAQNWEFGGNYDGEGFINKIVSEITAYKAIWVNAAGNYGSMVWNGSYKKTDATDIYHEKGSRLNFEVKFDATPVTVTVAWNDFQDFENHQTQKDLDVEILRSGIKQQFRNKRQSPQINDGIARSLHSREQDRLI